MIILAPCSFSPFCSSCWWHSVHYAGVGCSAQCYRLLPRKRRPRNRRNARDGTNSVVYTRRIRYDKKFVPLAA